VNNTLINTLLNKKRDIPFMVWWVSVMLVALAEVAQSTIVLLSLGLLMPYWSMSVLAWRMDVEMRYSKARRATG
jgi:hypothetical protein